MGATAPTGNCAKAHRATKPGKLWVVVRDDTCEAKSPAVQQRAQGAINLDGVWGHMDEPQKENTNPTESGSAQGKDPVDECSDHS